jgi:hypothetical protein
LRIEANAKAIHTESFWRALAAEAGVPLGSGTGGIKPRTYMRRRSSRGNEAQLNCGLRIAYRIRAS